MLLLRVRCREMRARKAKRETRSEKLTLQLQKVNIEHVIMPKRLYLTHGLCDVLHLASSLSIPWLRISW